MKRFYLFFVLAALIVFGQTAQAESSYSAVWKIAHNETERGSDHFFAVKFKDLVEQKSGGNIKVDIFPLGTLGDGSSNLEMLQEGGVEFAIADSGYIGSFVPESQLFRVHFLLTDDMALNRKLLKGKAMDIMNAEFLKNGMQVMLHFQKGFVNWTGNKPFRTLADFKGLKMRTVPAPILIEIYKLYGANPTAVNYAELYSALQLGLVEAQENDLTPIEELKLNEVQKVLTVSNHYSFIMTCVVSYSLQQPYPPPHPPCAFLPRNSGSSSASHCFFPVSHWPASHRHHADPPGNQPRPARYSRLARKLPLQRRNAASTFVPSLSPL